MSYISWSSDIALYLGPRQIERDQTLEIVKSDTVNEHILFVGQYDLYFMVQ